MADSPLSSALHEQVSRIAGLCEALQHSESAAGLDQRTRDLLERVGEACASLSEFLVSDADSDLSSHRLRNELNHVLGPLQLLLRRPRRAEHQSRYAEIEAALNHCLGQLDAYDQAPRQDLRESSATASPSSLTSLIAQPARILVAEDDAENREFLRDVLVADGHAVTLASDGEQALEYAESEEFDLLLVDLDLPVLNGFALLEHLQDAGWRTPIVVVTGRRGVDDAVKCIQRGADDFLTKPIQLEILRARIASCVEKVRLREREFGQFFPPKLARSFARRPKLIDALPSKHADVSVLFCDIRNFTAISERLGAELTTEWLRAVMNEMSECVIANEGVLVDFAGDEIMAMWGAPDEVNDHADRACNTALEILRRLPRISEQWHERIGSVTDLAVGVNSGRAMVGHIGTVRKTKYGALGDAVNIGSRVLGATRHLRTRCLISGTSHAALESALDGALLRRLGAVKLKNLEQAVQLWELIPTAPGAGSQSLYRSYQRAQELFEAANFQPAAAILGQLLVENPNDGPSLVLMSRVVEAMLADGGSFDPIWQLSDK